MISLQRRLELLEKLRIYLIADDVHWQQVQEAAVRANGWFTQENIKLAINNIAGQFLPKEKLDQWLAGYALPVTPRKVGIVMAGNIPLVGFHDFLCGFVSGHNLFLKLSSKDEILLKHIIHKFAEWEPEVASSVHIAEMLKGCDAYIATGSNNTARYFEQYFGKYPHIIRRNRTSVAVLDGTETTEELQDLSRDVFSYFGLGCRNVTQVYLPKGYEIPKLIDVFNNHADLVEHNKYKNNFDYHLALYLLNKVPHYTNNSFLVVENDMPFSAVSVLHYKYYDDRDTVLAELAGNIDIQCTVGHGALPFGSSQSPELTDYADGVDTMAFLCSL